MKKKHKMRSLRPACEASTSTIFGAVQAFLQRELGSFIQNFAGR